MAKTQSTDFLERIIPHVRSGGARNIVELAGALRIPVETTRYNVKGMQRRGLTVHASVEYNKFGLASHEAYLVLSSRAQSREKRLFQVLAEYSFLTSYVRELPDNSYVCSFAVPRNASLLRLVRGLTEEGLIGLSRVEPLSWKKSHMLEPTFFQLKRGVWKIDWNKIRKQQKKREDNSNEATKKSSIHFDELDILIARSLERDALVKLSEIADSLKTTLNNVFYHFHKHVLREKLVEEFLIRWNGSPKQESVFAQFEFDNLSMKEENSARSVLRKLPFLWSDASGLDTGFYIGEAMIPTTQYLQSLQYLSETLGGASKKLGVRLLDPKSRYQFPLPTHLFREGEWKFEPDTCVDQVVAKLKR